jgi:hypothetical protein
MCEEMAGCCPKGFGAARVAAVLRLAAVNVHFPLLLRTKQQSRGDIMQSVKGKENTKGYE